MKAGFGTASGSEGGGDASFVPPSVEAMARLFPQLDILELIGKGGMGAVYKARQPGLDRLVALKILPPRTGNDPGFAERFTREARALARLSHPNIVGVYDFGQVSGAGVPPAAGGTQPITSLHYFLMEYVDGPNLRQVERAGKLSPREALQIIPQICEALQYAHDEGIVHRDIKPENVLLDKKGRVKIADFGLAKILGREPQDFRLTGAGQVMGTPNYMAPEQVEHPQEVDHRADIYSLGVVFYEMLTGELPLGKFAPPSRKVQVDVRLDEVVMHALEKEPERRYQHASQIKSDVETISTHPGQAAPPVVPAATVALAAADERVQKQVKWPGIGLAVAAGFGCLSLPLFLVAAVGKMQSNALGLSKLVVLFLLATPFVLCGLNIYAALRMMRLEAYGAALAASIFAMLAYPGNVIGLPIGIWSLVVLARPEVREAFQKRRAALAAAGTGHSARTPLWFWLVAAAPIICLLVTLVTVHLTGAASARRPQAVTVKAFTPADRPISGELTLMDGDAWAASCTTTQTFRLFEVPNPGVEQCTVLYRARLKTAGLVGRAYLEMWCQFPGLGESFSRGLGNTISGSSDWATCQTPFFLKAGEKPDLIRLNLVVEGWGKIFIKDVEVTAEPAH